MEIELKYIPGENFKTGDLRKNILMNEIMIRGRVVNKNLSRSPGIISF